MDYTHLLPYEVWLNIIDFLDKDKYNLYLTSTNFFLCWIILESLLILLISSLKQNLWRYSNIFISQKPMD